jgi:hypothetical protein
MTTYTLTQAQFQRLYLESYSLKSEGYEILHSLKPNSQEPSYYLDGLNGCYSADRAKFLELDTSETKALYTHPAPISKEDMVKVLEALKCLIATNWPLEEATSSDGCYTDDPNEIKAREAITIMQSAIEGMK